MAVFVVNRRKKPLMPTSEKRAKQLLKKGRAVVINMYPFTIRLRDRLGGEVQPVCIKIDPGSQHTGVVVGLEKESLNTETGERTKKLKILNLFQINHRGKTISTNLTSRGQKRRRRRIRWRRNNLRYRKARFDNRKKPQRWLAPSLQHRVDTIMSFVNRLAKILPLTEISMELVRFDMQKMENPEISGVEYQQGELLGYEVREYILEKWNRTCAYCNAEQVPLEVEHIVPRSKGGSHKISNLTLACRACNQKKGSESIKVFLEKKPELLQKIQSLAKKPLKDAAAVNSTRFELSNQLKEFGVPVEYSSGGRTKFNRSKLSIPKTHALDAACVGEMDLLTNWDIPTLEITCTGRGSYQRTRLDKYGFPRGYLMREKSVEGFQTGDMVKATVTKGKKIGVYVGRVAVRATGNFNITTKEDTVQGINYRYCTLISRNNGYSYQVRPKSSKQTSSQQS